MRKLKIMNSTIKVITNISLRVIERNMLINRDNQILLNKLVDISHGKWLSVQPKAKASETFGPRSLNVGNRKRENERIERENQAFAKRLFAKQKEGSLSKKKMDEDYFN